MKEPCDCCREAGNSPCGCCEGIEIKTPQPVYNRPGLNQIAYRIGTHSAFFESMKARLNGFYLEHKDAEGKPFRTYPLTGLSTRAPNDPALALLDGWATVADVLTFYQERIANEGYLRTATERRSIVELAALVGYRPRPGVSASVFLAYNIDANTQEDVVITAGSRSQSMPGPGEMPQPFETSEDLQARAEWNNLKPRLARAQSEKAITDNDRVYLKGISTNLKANDALWLEFDKDKRFFKQVHEVLPDNAADRTLITFAPPPTSKDFEPVAVRRIIGRLVLPASLQPANRLQLRQDLRRQFALPAERLSQSSMPLMTAIVEPPPSGATIRPAAQAGYSVLGAFSTALRQHLATATAAVKLTEKKIAIYPLGIKAAVFGHNLPLPINGLCASDPPPPPPPPRPPAVVGLQAAAVGSNENLRVLALDAEYQSVRVGDRVAIKTTSSPVRFAKVGSVETMTLGGPQSADLAFFSTCPTITTLKNGANDMRPRFNLGEPIKIKVTVLTLDADWRDAGRQPDQVIKTTTVYIQSGKLDLAEEPITDPICGSTAETIELDGFYRDLEAGRRVIISGERSDVVGVRFSEAALLASVRHDVEPGLPDENRHTYIQLAEKLAYCFKRDTVTIYGNVVNATHGETRIEVLGSGNGAKALQSFALKQSPLTYVSAPTPSGIDSTLRVFVNHLEWRETETLAGLESSDRSYVVQTDNDGKTSVTFGNGAQGARPPSGVENIRAEYRNGIGKAGNVRAEQISLLLTKPLGVKEVINPLRATGGADRETRDQARKNVPLAVKALDRLVSTQDYQDFCRIFAGIGKAFAVELSDGRESLVHVTIAGAGDSPIDVNSDLYRNLRKSLHDFGDPFQKIQLTVRELLLIVIEAGIAILPAYRWEPVVTAVRAALLDAFSFERRELGQDVTLSEVIRVIQAVEGVAYVDVDAFGGVPEKQPVTDALFQKLVEEEINRLKLAAKAEVDEVEIHQLAYESVQKLIGNGNLRLLLTPDEIADEIGKVIARTQNLTPEQIEASGTKPRPVPQRLVVNVPIQERYIRPAQLAFLSPDVPATLILNQVRMP